MLSKRVNRKRDLAQDIEKLSTNKVQDNDQDVNSLKKYLTNFGVITSSHPTRVGRTASLGVVDYQIQDLEKFTYNRWQVLKLKIPSGFFENMSMIPSSLPLRIELTLAPSANMLIQRAAHASGDGNQSTTDNIKLARYRIDTTKTFLEVTYYKLPDGRDDEGNVIEGELNAQAEFEAQFFAQKAMRYHGYLDALKPMMKISDQVMLDEIAHRTDWDAWLKLVPEDMEEKLQNTKSVGRLISTRNEKTYADFREGLIAKYGLDVNKGHEKSLVHHTI